MIRITANDFGKNVIIPTVQMKSKLRIISWGLLGLLQVHVYILILEVFNLVSHCTGGVPHFTLRSHYTVSRAGVQYTVVTGNIIWCNSAS